MANLNDTIINGDSTVIGALNASKITQKGVPLLDLIYPVGTIYSSVNNMSPSSILGGKWEQIKDTFLWAVGSTNPPTGEMYHTLTISEIPSHNHSASGLKFNGNALTTSSNGSHTHTITISPSSHSHDYSAPVWYDRQRAGGAGGAYMGSQTKTTTSATLSASASTDGGHSHSVTLSGTITGSTSSNCGDSNGKTIKHNNMPPYQSVYMWKRIG